MVPGFRAPLRCGWRRAKARHHPRSHPATLQHRFPRPPTGHQAAWQSRPSCPRCRADLGQGVARRISRSTQHRRQGVSSDRRPALPVLIEALTDPAIPNHAQIANAVAWIGPPAKDAVPSLTALLKGHWDPARVEALIALAEIGPDAQGALPVVVRTLADPNERVRYQALLTLKQIGPKAIPILKEALRDKLAVNRLGACASGLVWTGTQGDDAGIARSLERL